jgi:putative ABC transport system ATP-binding protein
MLKLRGVTKTYPGKGGQPVHALKEVDLEVRAGEFVTVVGHSGSGKSTLLFTIGAMLRPTRGEILLEGTDVYGLSPNARAALRRGRVGFMFQTFNLIPYLGCRENVALPGVLAGRPRRECLRRAEKMLERLGMTHRLRHRPSELSVGERQRVALCRSQINEPALLLADEPTGNLDGERTEDVCSLLGELNSEGQTIIVVTHDERLAGVGSRVIRLTAGSIEAGGPHPSLAPEPEQPSAPREALG